VRVLSLGAGSHLKSLTGGSAPGAGAVGGSAIDKVAKAAAAARRGPSAGHNGEDKNEVMDWGIVNWAPHLISLLMDSSALSTDLLVGKKEKRKQRLVGLGIFFYQQTSETPNCRFL